MKLDLYQVDAFAGKVFEGNPAAVCPLQQWLDDAVMQSIASENNLAETAFFVSENDGFYIRWFTPLAEVDLCGHATLATAYVLFNMLGYSESEIRFNSKSGVLSVSRQGNLLQLNFPAQNAVSCEVPTGLPEALGIAGPDQVITECLFKDDYVVVLENEQQLRALRPNFNLLGEFDARGVIVTSPSEDYDFVNRFFAPQVGINEDPVTGSAFTKLIPYWAERLQKANMKAKQVSERGGEVSCSLDGDRVLIAGQAICYMQAQIEI